MEAGLRIMKITLKMEYLNKIYRRYHKASGKGKKQILDEFCEVCHYNRKYAIRLLNGVLPDTKGTHPRKKIFLYDASVISVLEEIWKSSGYLCSQRLKSAIPIWLPHFKMPLTNEVRQKLLSISPSTIDRRLKVKKRLVKKRVYSSTRPGTLLKTQIPVKTDNWDVRKPGFLEIDLVAHCGNSAEGVFIHSLNATDIHTGWTETRAIMGKGQIPALAALEDIKSSLPFKLLAIDPDNDGAFINFHLLKFCQSSKIQFTRSRPYKKDDNAHIEQKNWTNVRKIFGYLRYDSQEAADAINDLYQNELRLFQNLFLPSVKLLKKYRVGSKLKRLYDKHRTPFDRVCACRNADNNKIAELNFSTR